MDSDFYLDLRILSPLRDLLSGATLWGFAILVMMAVAA